MNAKHRKCTKELKNESSQDHEDERNVKHSKQAQEHKDEINAKHRPHVQDQRMKVMQNVEDILKGKMLK